MTDSTAAPDYDAIIVGAGFAGVYAVHKLRDQLGLTVHGFEAAEGVGGTWFWNRYPGARVDIDSVHYSYSFSEEIQQEWHWTERFAAQPEILRYLNHVADRLDVRRDISFSTRVTSVVWDDEQQVWVVSTDDGKVQRARYVISAAGTLSVPKKLDFRGVENFTGEVLMTGNWLEDVDLSGRRIGVIGTGSSGIQVISQAAKVSGELFVFQRTPNYATPVGNAPTDPAQEAAEKARYREIREASRNHFVGVPYDEAQPSALAVPAQERRAIFDDRWDRGGFRLVFDSFQDLLFNKESNDTAAEYIRERIRERVKDPKTADLLCPKGYPYGSKRPPLEIDYYEAFNRDNVHLIDVSSNAIDEVTENGVRLADGTEHEFDTLILATGFDAFTGPLMAMNITGRDGLRFSDAWADGPQTYLGIAVSGFPNLFMITGPQSPSVLYNMPLAIEDHVDFAAAAITHMREHGYTSMEATTQAQDDWVQQTDQAAQATVVPLSDTSWYMGANVPGKARKVLVYLGGAPAYRAFCAQVENDGYAGFTFSGSRALANA